MAAVIDDRQRRVPVSTVRMARAVDRALAAVGRPGGVVEVAIVDDAEIRTLNATHRGIRRRTDVLAFPLEVPDAGPLVGQLVIGADAAARQARRLRVPIALELDLLATHGTLHLVGYDDRDPVEADLMHRRERAILGDTPERLWRGLLAAVPSRRSPVERARARVTARRPLSGERRSIAGRPAPAERPPTARPPVTAERPPTARRPVTAERSRRPSRTAHPRLEPTSPRSLQ